MRMNYEFGEPAVKVRNKFYFISGATEQHGKSVVLQGIFRRNLKYYEDTFVISNQFFNKMAEYQNSVHEVNSKPPRVDLKLM